MTLAADWMTTVLTRELDSFIRELHLFPDEASVWQTVPGVTNSAGTLALHVSGNLLYFIGAVLGGSGYVRDRRREFSARDIPRTALIADLSAARDVVARVMLQLSEDDLSQPYPEELVGSRIVTGLFLTHLSAHLAFHLGQAGYLRRVATGDSRSSSPLPLTGLVSSAPQ